MTTKNRVLFSTLIIALVSFIFACEKPVDGGDPILPGTVEPVLISYFSPLEQVLFYAEEHWEAVVSDAHLIEANATGSRYSGYLLNGEPQVFDISLVPVPQAELVEISKEQDFMYEQLVLDIDPAELAFLAARGRRHMGMKCGKASTQPATCEEVNDSTSIKRIYNEFKRCEDGLESDECTEFSVVWFTKIEYNAPRCENGVGSVVKVSEEKDWRCYQ